MLVPMPDGVVGGVKSPRFYHWNTMKNETHDKTNKESNSRKCKCIFVDITDNSIKIKGIKYN
jgi:hypothetical protein